MKAVSAGDGVAEQRDLRWGEGQDQKSCTHRKQQRDCQPCRNGTGFSGFEKSGLQSEGHSGGNEKDGDIKPVCGFAQNSRIGIVEHRDQDQTG